MRGCPCANVGHGMDNPTPTIAELHEQLLEKLRKQHLLDNPSVEAAFTSVPRHLFLPHVTPDEAYEDKAIPIKTDQSGVTVSSSSQPTMMALMLEQVALEKGLNVLEIGTASGYNAAIMKHIVGETGTITSLELDHDIALQAINNLSNAGFSNVNLVEADAAQGYSPRAMYDRIISTVGIWDVPIKWTQQLKPAGRLVVPIWLDGVQISATFIPQADGTFYSEDNRPCAFVYLRGSSAGPQVSKRIGSTSLVILADEVDKIDTASLHSLLSDDQEIHSLGKYLEVEQYWYGFQLYLMLNEPERYIFALYGIAPGQKAYGMEGDGIALITPGGAAFAGYRDGGTVHTFAGSDAYLEMQNHLNQWLELGRPGKDQLRAHLIPKDHGKPAISKGKLYIRKNHYLHIWLT